MSAEQKIDKLIEEATRFDKELKKANYQKKLDMLRRAVPISQTDPHTPSMWPKNTKNFNYVMAHANEIPTKSQPQMERALIKGNDYIPGYKKIIRGNEVDTNHEQFLKKNGKIYRRNFQSGLGPNYTREKTDTSYMFNHKFNIDPEKDIPVVWGGGKTFFENLSKRKHGIPLDTEKGSGIYVHPIGVNNDSFSSADQAMARTDFYSGRAANKWGDDPLEVRGTIKAKHLKPADNAYEAIIPHENFKNLDITFKNRMFLGSGSMRNLPVSFTQSPIAQKFLNSLYDKKVF